MAEPDIRGTLELIERLSFQSVKRGLSVYWLVTKAIELYLERLEAISDE